MEVLAGRVFRAGDKIHDLIDIVLNGTSGEKADSQEIVIIDGRVYERVLTPQENIYDLSDVVEEGFRPSLIDNDLHNEILKSITSIAEGIAREIIPEIAERIIREEIEKLKENTQPG